ncbi:MAG: hypothetical protein FJ395_03635 [Verrucomicrobia bacterium]|nr:hypothetical protein [Verrucomicrobiota bacterium]
MTKSAIVLLLALGIANAAPHTILLVDDHDILYRSGTVRVLHPAQRHPQNPVILQDKPWEVAIGWTSIHRDAKTGKYQLWYQAYAGKRAGDKRLECVVCYAESEDGVRFVKPEFDFHPFKEFKKTNIVLIGNGGYGDRYCNSVLVDTNEKDPSRRYKMAYYDWSVVDGREYPGLHVAFSQDGIRWTKHNKGPLNRTAYGGRGQPPPFADEDIYQESPGKNGALRKTWRYPLTMSDAADVFYDPVRAVFAIYGKMWMDAPDGTMAWKHGMGRIESKDFLHWSKPQFLLGPDDQDTPDAEFHTSPVFFYADRYFCLNQIMDRRAKGAIDIELMTSRDGLVWERSFRQPYFLARSEAGQFDSRCLFSNSTPIVLDDEIRFYYGAYNQSPIGGVRAETGHRSGVGLATIPRDRFAGVRPVSKSSQPTLKKPLENIGQITLKPRDLTGVKTISINADASKGEVRLEVLTEDGYRIRGFSKDDAVPVQGDSLNHSVAWKGRNLSQLPPGRYMLRLHLNNAEVFAIYLP